jgi:hypothetical protein
MSPRILNQKTKPLKTEQRKNIYIHTCSWYPSEITASKIHAIFCPFQSEIVTVTSVLLYSTF